jgi:hypothetical protein
MRLTCIHTTSAANIGVNGCHPNCTVAWQMSLPRSCSRSSSSRCDKRNRTYIIAAKRMIAGLVVKERKGLRRDIAGRYRAAFSALSQVHLKSRCESLL